MCFYNVKAQCLIPYILLFSKTATTGSSTALPPRSNLTPTPTPSWTSHHNIICESLPSCANSSAAEILQAIHCQFCHTALYKEIYSWSRSCCTLCQRVFQVVLLKLLSDVSPRKMWKQGPSDSLTWLKRILFSSIFEHWGHRIFKLIFSSINLIWASDLWYLKGWFSFCGRVNREYVGFKVNSAV